MVAKGRHAHGERHSSRVHPEACARGSGHGLSKLTDEIVLSMRRAFYEQGVPASILGRRYGVSPTAARDALMGRTWTHLGVPGEQRYRQRAQLSQSRGERNRSKLTESQVRDIREVFSAGLATLTELGRQYGLAANTIRGIVLRWTWKHVA